MKRITIAIDGPASSGKSTLAKAMAEVLHYNYVDSGAYYRAVALFLQQKKIDWNKNEELKPVLNDLSLSFHYNVRKRKSIMLVNGKDIEPHIRSMKISELVSEVSAVPEVRKFVTNELQKIPTEKGIVMDGRDIGTVVFPDAELKIFMTADPKTRSERRYKELKEKGDAVSEKQISDNLSGRDLIDSTRKTNPLKKADDAVELDNTLLREDEQLDYALQLAVRKIIDKG